MSGVGPAQRFPQLRVGHLGAGGGGSADWPGRSHVAATDLRAGCQVGKRASPAERLALRGTQKKRAIRKGWLVLWVSIGSATLCRRSSLSPSVGQQADSTDAEEGEGRGLGNGNHTLGDCVLAGEGREAARGQRVVAGGRGHEVPTRSRAVPLIEVERRERRGFRVVITERQAGRAELQRAWRETPDADGIDEPGVHVQVGAPGANRAMDRLPGVTLPPKVIPMLLTKLSAVGSPPQL